MINKNLRKKIKVNNGIFFVFQIFKKISNYRFASETDLIFI